MIVRAHQSTTERRAQPATGPGTKPRTAPRSLAIECTVAGVIFWLIAAGLQWKVGAFGVEFGSNSDEAAHYVTGLMIRNYIISIGSGHFTSPLAYAENYYVHYPKVAIGKWPPLFHLTEAGWSLLFSSSKVSIMLLMALITALIGTSIYWILRRQYSALGAFGGGALFVVSPLVQASTDAVMADSLVALLDCWAMIFMIRYLEDEQTRDAVLVGFCAGLSMATKANGVALVLLPIFAVLITRRFHLLRTRGMYYAGLVVLVLGVPWQVLSYYLIRHSEGVPQVSLVDRLYAGLKYGLFLLTAPGWSAAPFFLLGLALFLSKPWRRRLDLTLACALALLLSVWAYHTALGFGGARYMLGALPAAILFVVAGFAWVVRRVSLPGVPRKAVLTALGVLVGGVLVFQCWLVPHKLYGGFDQPAHFLLSNGEFAHGNFLVVSSPSGEGAFISEVAMHEQGFEHIIVRSSKFLSSSTWNGTKYQLRCQSPQELRVFLDDAPIDAVILDNRSGQPGNPAQLQAQVAQALLADPHWKFRDRYPKLPGHDPWINLYTRVGDRPPGDLRIDMRYTLGRDLVHTDANSPTP